MLRAISTPSKVLLTLLLTAGCRHPISDKPTGSATSIEAPLGLPPVPIPGDNPPTTATIALGRRLFYDTRLSKGSFLACSNCHNPRYAFTDGNRLSKGFDGALGVRNAPTLLNATYLPFQFWDGRALTLEQQAASPIADPVEMNSTHKASVARLAGDPTYGPAFTQAFGTPDITIGRVTNALASFERTLLSGDSPFDRYQYAGDKTALTPAALRGLAVFLNPMGGNCASCHTIGPKSALLTDGKFHNIGEGASDNGFADVGRYHETKVVTDQGAFKTPSLRNISRTAPYMHDGSLKTLKEVVDFYAGGGNSNPYLDPQMKTIHLTPQDRLDLVEFLKSLDGSIPGKAGPP
ncbi:cytochrome-c peroxidase [Granulicella sibirica]|uniref:Methylamine utilization protein MauG n=1 Tax=Granulicella sibirica TaxID=2479048 RepID=A0A4Q0SZA1_9BACT|nr:cytochrome c peroxidase [Granulicella sibirica]RXH54551.1 Cytochrome c551 peroxidase [Granulicella sibirica]